MKLNLDDFKSMANNVQEQDAMNNIEGGLSDWSDCHGFWGQLHKFIVEVLPIIIN